MVVFLFIFKTQKTKQHMKNLIKKVKTDSYKISVLLQSHTRHELSYMSTEELNSLISLI